MKIFTYRKWDGSQDPFSLHKKDIVDRFMENIMKGMRPDISLAQMFWNGFPMAGMNFRVMGLSELIAELEKEKKDLFSQYNLESAFDKPMDDIRFLLADEAMTRSQKGMPSPPSYESLSGGLMKKLREMASFDFENQDSRALFDHWQSRENDILDLYHFYGEFGEKFVGDQALDFDQAIELMRRFQAMEQMQQQLMNGDITGIDLDALKEILGDPARQSLNILLQLPDVLAEEGVADLDRKKGFNMTPRGMRALGETAFGKLYRHIKRDRQGRQPGQVPQSGEIEPDTSRPYEYGDRFDLDINKTVLKAVTRSGFNNGAVELSHEDIHVREREQLVTATTVVLLDLSWSMSWEGRFEAGKKVALALDHYIRSRFPKDSFHVVGFSTEARELRGDELALSVWDTQAPYTNLQGGLRLAMQLIKKSGNRNNRVIVITDGQPTAYYEDDQLYVELPESMFGLSPNACKATLAEVRKVTAMGMNIETFMLDNNPVLVEFTHTIARINRGRAVMCLPDELGDLVLVEEVKRRGGKL